MEGKRKMVMFGWALAGLLVLAVLAAWRVDDAALARMLGSIGRGVVALAGLAFAGNVGEHWTKRRLAPECSQLVSTHSSGGRAKSSGTGDAGSSP